MLARLHAPCTDRAEVVRVDPVGGYDRYQYRPNGGVSYERQECWKERINGYEGGYYRDGDGRLYREGENHTNTGGMLIGALVGGALDNTVGKGDGRTAATIGGAVIGGAIGAHVDDDRDYDYRDNSGVVRRCRTVVTTVDNGPPDDRGPRGYRVTCVYAGQTYKAIMGERPLGRYIPITVDVRAQDVDRRYRR